MTKLAAGQSNLNSERVFALDALRGIMMLLGIFIHAALIYAPKSSWAVWGLKDPDDHYTFRILVEFIHAFRMPVFFVAAGFFGALLYYRKGPTTMLLNRVKRIILPFIVAVILVWPLIRMAIAFSKASFGGSLNPYAKAWQIVTTMQFIPFKMGHLWFLYFLGIYAFGGWLVAMVFNKETVFTQFSKQAISHVFRNFWLRLLVVTAIYFLCLFGMGTEGIISSFNWIPNPFVLLIYFVFFGLGWMIYRTNSLESLKSYSLVQLFTATILFFVSTLAPWPDEAWVLTFKQILTALYGSLFIFGFTAFFLTYFNSYSKRLSYLMEASYWVYIIHLPILLFIPGLMAGSMLPILLKFAITLSVTIVLSMLSYKYLVRNSFIGMFLNGKIHKKPTDLIAAEKVTVN